MDQNINNRHKEILWDLLANPVENGQSYRQTLERLVQDNPQSGLLQVMYARSAETPEVRTPSTYFNPRVLHKILHEPDGLLPVSRDRINKSLNGGSAAEPENYFNIGPVAEMEAEPAEEISDAPVAAGESLITQEVDPPVEVSPATEEEPAEAELQQTPPEQEQKNNYAAEEEQAAAQPDAEIAAEQHTEEEPPPLPAVIESPLATPAIEPQITEPQIAAASQQHDDDDDTFADPWDFSRLEETPEIEVSETATSSEDIAPVELGTVVPPEQELEAVEIPESTEPVLAFNTPADIYIETYDHSLSSHEQDAVNNAGAESAADEQQEAVSSFDNYRVENVFHRQDYIEDEVYDEIVSIDEIGVETLGNKFALDTLPEEEIEKQPAEEPVAAQQSYIDDETEKLIYGNIAATDYLSFDKKLDELRSGINTPAPAEKPVAPVAEKADTPAEATVVTYAQPVAEPAKEPDVISKYNDDSLPYSFMWWLDKTRKEHASAHQPYAEPVQQAVSENIYRPEFNPSQENRTIKNNPDELQQQYYANIFSLTSVSSIGDVEPPKIAFDPDKKEDVIIERFIHTDPQIKPLSADKLDNENKAKKSSEDQNIMVTETLARIYGDQMLYHKAIATYKKLMLKFPEKKLYFAAQIEQLEKKIN